MKLVRIYLVLFLVATALSCKKEHSREGSPLPDSWWQFNESEQVFKGPIDSAVVESATGIETLVIYGTSDDGLEGKFSLKIEREKIGEGFYDGSGIRFRYEVGDGYLSKDGASDFRVLITRIEGESISGTFSGVAVDGTGATHEIASGKFQCSFSRKQSPKHSLVVWSKELCGAANQLEVRIDNLSRFITNAFPAQPTCGSDGAAIFELDPGSYPVQVICGGDTAAYTAQVSDDECSFLEVDVYSDYLPLGKSSYWEYADKEDENVRQIFTAGDPVTLNNQDYTQLTGSRGVTYYFRKIGHSYFQYRELSFQDFVEDPPWVELVILKDNLAKGQTWETEPIDATINDAVQKIKMVSRIVDRDYSDVIHGVQYDNLIKVNTELFFSPDNGHGYATSGSAYETVFAKGKGIVSYADMDVAIEWGVKNIFLRP